MNPTGSHGVTGYYITKVHGLQGIKNSNPILNRRELLDSNPGGGPSPGDKH
jgi:hypothetical protein